MTTGGGILGDTGKGDTLGHVARPRPVCSTKTSETYRCGCAWFADDTITGLWMPCPYHATLGLEYPPELNT